MVCINSCINIHCLLHTIYLDLHSNFYIARKRLRKLYLIFSYTLLIFYRQFKVFRQSIHVKEKCHLYSFFSYNALPYLLSLIAVNLIVTGTLMMSLLQSQLLKFSKSRIFHLIIFYPLVKNKKSLMIFLEILENFLT